MDIKEKNRILSFMHQYLSLSSIKLLSKNNSTAITSFFRRKAEKNLGLLRVVLQKLTFCRNVKNILNKNYSKVFFIIIISFSSLLSEEEKTREEYRKEVEETVKRLSVIIENKNLFYNKFRYPITLPEVKRYIFRAVLRYKTVVHNQFNEPIQFENCFGSFGGSPVRMSKDDRREEERINDAIKSECNKRNQNLSWTKSEEVRTDAIQKEWRRSNCKNQEILALIDFQNFLQKDDKLFRACIQLKDEQEEANFIRSTKLKIFELIREPILEFPKEFKTLNPIENDYINSIFKLSLELLIEYGNFESYYENLSHIENPLYVNHDLIFDVIYPPDKINRLENLQQTLNSHKSVLLYDEFTRGQERGSLLLSQNQTLLSEIKEANIKISNNQYIPSLQKNQFNSLQKCLEDLSDKHLERINLGFYSGLFKKYSSSEYSPSYKALLSKETIEIFNLYHKNIYLSKLLELRLLNRIQNCNLVKSNKFEEFSFPIILQNTCNLNDNTKQSCENF